MLPSPLICLAGIGGLAAAHVVGERDEIDGVGEDFAVLSVMSRWIPLSRKYRVGVAGVGAAGVDVAEHEVGVVGVQHGQDVGRVGGQRVDGHCDEHAADLDTGMSSCAIRVARALATSSWCTA